MDVFILDSSGGEVEAVMDAFTALETTRRMFRPNSYKLEARPSVEGAALLERGRVLLFGGAASVPYVVEQVHREDDSVAVVGRGVDGLLEHRVCVPPPDFSHDSYASVAVDSVMRSLVKKNAGPSAAVARRVPGLAVAADTALGPLVTVHARYQPVAELLEAVGTLTGWGYEVTRQPDGGYVFDVVAGTDRSSEVFFDPEFDTVRRQELLSGSLDRRTHAYVAGSGEGELRTLVERWLGATEPTGFERRELFVDARDVDTVAGLAARGDEKLAETQAADVFRAEVNPHGSFRYREHWDLGDLVTLRNEEWGVSQATQIVAVTERRTSEGVELTVELDGPWPTLRTQIARSRTPDATGRA